MVSHSDIEMCRNSQTEENMEEGTGTTTEELSEEDNTTEKNTHNMRACLRIIGCQVPDQIEQ